MIVLDVWALAVLAGCVWIAQRHSGQRAWTGAVIVAAIAVVSLLGETMVAGKSAGLGEALLLIAPALGSVFIVLPYRGGRTRDGRATAHGPCAPAGRAALALGHPRVGCVDGPPEPDHRGPGAPLTGNHPRRRGQRRPPRRRAFALQKPRTR